MVKRFLLPLFKLFYVFFFPTTELFYLSHKLVDLYPNNPVSVPAVSVQTLYYFQDDN